MKKEKNDQRSILSRINDNVKIAFLRFWFVGLIYYLIGWGTNLGESDSPFDLIFVLSLITAAGHLFIFNPIMYKMFDVQRNGIFVNKKYSERSIFQNVICNLLEFFKCVFITILVFLTYQLINYILIDLLKLSPLGGEPILYGIFFTLYYSLLSLISDKCIKFYRNKKGKE